MNIADIMPPDLMPWWEAREQQRRQVERDLLAPLEAGGFYKSGPIYAAAGEGAVHIARCTSRGKWEEETVMADAAGRRLLMLGCRGDWQRIAASDDIGMSEFNIESDEDYLGVGSLIGERMRYARQCIVEWLQRAPIDTDTRELLTELNESMVH